MEDQVTIFDVAKYIITMLRDVSSLKLQRLCYYVKVWGIVWDEEEIFKENFEAWATGAICPPLWQHCSGKFKVTLETFKGADISKIPALHQETIDKVIEFYGKYTAQQLSDINQQEAPWREARQGLAPESKCSSEITSASIHEFYSGLLPNSPVN